MSEVLLKRGFELSLGFLHISDKSKQYYWNRLSYDFIEPYRVWIYNSVKEMVEDKEIEPKDFTIIKTRLQWSLRNKALKVGLNNFTTVLKPLEYQSLPIIRQVESML